MFFADHNYSSRDQGLQVCTWQKCYINTAKMDYKLDVYNTLQGFISCIFTVLLAISVSVFPARSSCWAVEQERQDHTHIHTDTQLYDTHTHTLTFTWHTLTCDTCLLSTVLFKQFSLVHVGIMSQLPLMLPDERLHLELTAVQNEENVYQCTDSFSIYTCTCTSNLLSIIWAVL